MSARSNGSPSFPDRHGERGVIPKSLIRDYVNDRQADLVVLGTHGRSPLLQLVIGSRPRAFWQCWLATPC